MKTITKNAMMLGVAGLLLMGCDKEEATEMQPLDAIAQEQNFGTDPTSCEIIEFEEATGNVNTVYSQGTPVQVSAQLRLPNGKFKKNNTALVIDTSVPNPQGFRTPNPAAIRPMGNILTISEGKGKKQAQAISDEGGRIELDFSAMGTITLKGIHILDIEKHEAATTIEVLDAKGRVLKTLHPPVTGAKGATRVSIEQKGVAKLRVTFESTQKGKGGGAIDVIEFCRD